MPTVLRVGPYRFVFYPHDVIHEPPHVHVKRDQEEAKFWLAPVDLEWNRGYPGHELREIEGLRSCLADGYFAETQRATCTNGAQMSPVAALPGECRTRSARDPAKSKAIDSPPNSFSSASTTTSSLTPGTMSKTASSNSLTRESLERELMSARIARVDVSRDMITLSLEDGRLLGMPTAWSPRLKRASLEELRNVEITGRGTSLHWPDLDEDVNVRGILLGRMSAEREASLEPKAE